MVELEQVKLLQTWVVFGGLFILSCVHLADRIIVLDEGHVVQQGSHSELVTQPGLYAELYALQSQKS